MMNNKKNYAHHHNNVKLTEFLWKQWTEHFKPLYDEYILSEKLLSDIDKLLEDYKEKRTDEHMKMLPLQRPSLMDIEIYEPIIVKYDQRENESSYYINNDERIFVGISDWDLMEMRGRIWINETHNGKNRVCHTISYQKYPIETDRPWGKSDCKHKYWFIGDGGWGKEYTIKVPEIVDCEYNNKRTKELEDIIDRKNELKERNIDEEVSKVWKNFI